MATKSPVQFERSHIDLGDAVQVRYWSKHFGVNPNELRSAVEKVGNAASTVRKELAARAGEPQQET